MLLIFYVCYSGYSKIGESHELDTFISMTIDCMVLLKEVPRFSDVRTTPTSALTPWKSKGYLTNVVFLLQDLKNQMEEKLLGVVNSASQQVIEFGDTNGINVNDASLFSELLKVRKYYI